MALLRRAPLPARLNNLSSQGQGGVMSSDPVARSPFISRSSNASVDGVMNKLIAGTEITVSDAVSSFDQDILLPAAYQPLVGTRSIVGFGLVFAGLRGVMPTGFTAADLLETLAAGTIVTISQGNKIEHEISGLFLVQNKGGEFGFEARIEPTPGAFEGVKFNVTAASIPRGAVAPKQWFVTPKILTIWAE